MFVVFDRPRCAWVELDIIIPRRFASSGGRIAPVGVLWVLGEEGILYKDVMPSHHEGHHHLPNWTRIIPTP